jgi:RAD3-like DEAD/DEAH box helicase
VGAPVSVPAFEQQMEKHWVEALGNSSSDNLRAVWRQLGSAFGEAIFAHGKPEGKTWRVLQPPTGTGKTQGLCVYAAMLAKQNAKQKDEDKTGMLVVTQLIAQCDEVVERTNEVAGSGVALASHSESKPHRLQMGAVPILVITHQAYINAIKGLSEDGAQKWSDYTNWMYGERELIVIDEALSNMVEESQVKSSAVSQALGLIPAEIKSAYKSQISALNAVDKLFSDISEKIDERPDDGLTSTRNAWTPSADLSSRLVTFPERIALVPTNAA